VRRRAADFLVRVLVRLKPQRWCPPAISLRLFRVSAEASNEATTAAMRQRLPGTGGWSTRRDLSYATGRDGLFDLTVPDGAGPHPLVVWVHGGGWYSGSKADVLPYLELLATRGFAGAAVNYPRAPRSAYPAAPDAVEAAVQHLTSHAEDYGIDPSRVVLAGDSAGAHIAGELAIRSPESYRGALLFCGTYDPTRVDDTDRIFAAALETVMWSVTRSRRWRETAACSQMTVLDRVTAHFPPTFLSAGDLDPLTRNQSLPMIRRLTELGVPLDSYVPDEPSYHEFQFRLGTPAADEAFERTVTFLRRVLV